MHPYINVAGLELPVYGMIIIFSYITGLLICASLGNLYGIQRKYILSSGSFIAAGLLIGAKVLYCITKLPAFIADYGSLYSNYNLLDKIEYLFGGYVFYGGLIGAIVGILIFCKSFNFDSSSMINVLTPLIPYAHAFGRIGCFFGGCCYGMEYHGFGAITYPHNPLSPSLHLVPRFPVQLLEATLNLILFFFLYYYTRKYTPSKFKTLGIYLVCYSIIRFVLEFFRGDIIRGFLLGLSTSQWISIILLPVGIYLINRHKFTLTKRQLID